MSDHLRLVCVSLGLAVAFSSGCSSAPTQIIVTIDGPVGLAEVAIEVDGLERAREHLPLEGDGANLPLSLTLLHGGGGFGPIAVSATGYSDDVVVVARDCVLATFRRGETVHVDLELAAGTIEACAAPPDGGVVDAGHDAGTEDAGADAGVSCDPAACALETPASSCMDGRCTIITCQGMSLDCEREEPNECETSPQTSADHCGGCGNACEPGETCTGGTCQ